MFNTRVRLTSVNITANNTARYSNIVIQIHTFTTRVCVLFPLNTNILFMLVFNVITKFGHHSSPTTGIYIDISQPFTHDSKYKKYKNFLAQKLPRKFLHLISKKKIKYHLEMTK